MKFMNSRFGIRLELAANNDAVIYLDSATDPWTNEWNNTTTAITLDNVIGVDNYDIGHNYNDTGGGNAGCLGCVCAANSTSNFHKGRGWTGSGNPIGDPFYIDYVAHEMGHQFYGFHTMNVCSRSGYNTEVEPGSGSSIMGYAKFVLLMFKTIVTPTLITLILEILRYIKSRNKSLLWSNYPNW